jgi:CheY-like chemotaxis protein
MPSHWAQPHSGQSITEAQSASAHQAAKPKGCSLMHTVIAIVDDLFFASKIRGTGEQVGTRVQFSRSIPDAVAKAREEAPALIIADLNAGCCDVLELARVLKGDNSLDGIPLLGFFSHIQTELQQAAIAAGYDRVMPRSAFTKNLRDISAEAEPR